MKRDKTLVLFGYDWDRIEFQKLQRSWPQMYAGFDLFSSPSNLQLAWFDLERFSALTAWRAKLRGASAVVSNHDHFGALAAAMVAERMNWPGTSVEAVLACQHKLYAREVMERIAPEANVPFRRLDTAYNADLPEDLEYPSFVKPVKAAFSVLARTVHNHQTLFDHTRFSRLEWWLVRRLVEPFEKIVQSRLPEAGTAHSLMLEGNLRGHQYCLDGYCFNGKVRRLGIVDAIMYPGTQAFMRWDYPSLLPDEVQQKAEALAARFLGEIGFTHGFFNMEFVIDEDSGEIKVIEFNPRLASQFSDLYARVDGIRAHEMTLALGHGIDPATLPTDEPRAGCASSFVYRVFDPSSAVHMPSTKQKYLFHSVFPDGLLLQFPKLAHAIERDFKWLGNYRYGIMHLGGSDAVDLFQRCERASGILGWTPPYAEHVTERPDTTADGIGWTGEMGTENASR